MKAFILVTTNFGAEKEVIEELRKIEGVVEAKEVYSTFDVVVTVEAETVERIREIVTFHIRKLNNVKTTLSLFCIEEKSEGDGMKK